MPQTELHVPTFLNYDCQTCGWCCKHYELTFSAKTHQRLNTHNWGALEPQLAGKQWCAPMTSSGPHDSYRLRFTPERACIFLNPDNKCLMHAHVGELGKILACCVYPFTFLDTPTGIYVGCRFGCPAVTRALGRPLTRRKEALDKQLQLVRNAGLLPHSHNEVIFSGSRTLPWRDYIHLENTLIRILLREDIPLVRRILAVHKFNETLSIVKLKKIRGQKFREFLQTLEPGLLNEAANEPLPGNADHLRRALFRQHCLIFQRRHGGAYHELRAREKLNLRLDNFKRSIQFTFAFGNPHLPGFPGPFAVADVARVTPHTLQPEDELALSRYLAAKIFGKQYFGKLFFGYPLRLGIVFLLLSAGAVMWYARAHAIAQGRRETNHNDLIEAIRYVDYCYGSSPVPNTIFQRLNTRITGFDDSYIRSAIAQFQTA